eukprot:496162-Pyramimonas_sp.AAC.1
MGIALPYRGARGRGPETWWRPVLGRDRGSVRYPELHSMRWLSSVFQAFVSSYMEFLEDSPSLRSELDRRARLLAQPPDFIKHHQ